MFEYIKGTVAYIEENYIIIESNNIGYRVLTSAIDIARVGVRQEITLYTYMHIRENDISLIGFLSREEIKVFELLISISGVGPKGGIAIMSVLSLDEIRLAVLSSDSKAIAKANGIGPKIAQRVVLELKDKFKLEEVFGDNAVEDDLRDNSTNDIISETALALTSLGYTNTEALKAIKKVPDAAMLSVEELLKAALKHIM